MFNRFGEPGQRSYDRAASRFPLPVCVCGVVCVCVCVHGPQVLNDFPHTTAELSVDYLLDLFPEIQPRSFSIASSLLVRLQH